MRRTIASALLVCAQVYAADVWKTAGAAPASWQRDRVADLAAHRKGLMEAVGDKGIAILYAAEPRNYANDVDWPYRQENDFFYLTGMPQEGGALVLIPGASVKEILFTAPSNPMQEAWTGHILSVDEARKISGIQVVYDARQLKPFLAKLLPQAAEMLAEKPAQGGRGGGRGALPEPKPLPADLESAFQGTIDLAKKGELQVWMVTRGMAEHRRESEFAAKLGALSPALKVTDATEAFGKLRRVKSDREKEMLQHAVDITAEAFQRAYALAVPGTPEYEIQAQFEFTFLRRNAHWGYPCIVASGVNATTLHYETNKDTMKAGDLLLMDDAAEFDGYSVDVTRTIPVSGKFNKEQAEIYRLVWDAQQAAIGKVKPGHRMSVPPGGKIDPESVSGAAIEVFKQGLLKLGLITDVNSTQQIGVWFNHGIGHGIGLNVHDPGGAELQPGMTVTVEPGIYIHPNALDRLPKTPENEKFIAAVRPAFEKYKGIGVRIEDDVLVTNGEPKVMSAMVPSKLEEVEATIARLRKAVKSNPLP